MRIKPKRLYHLLRLVTFGLLSLSIVLWVATIIGWFLTDPSYETLNVFVSSILSTALTAFSWLGTKIQVSHNQGAIGGTKNELAQLRFRKKILENTYSVWIRDYLERVLSGPEYLTLRVTNKNEYVISSTPSAPKSEVADIPENESLEEALSGTVFAGRSLLILGETGSGKTTLALTILKDLLHSAKHDHLSPIPLFLKLNTWKHSDTQLIDWIIEETEKIYDIPGEITRNWIKEGETALLLDGIDEVERRHRRECVDAINDFLSLYHPISTTVTSRTAPYIVLPARLKLNRAIILQPYSFEQVEKYLSFTSEGLSELKSLILDSPNLREFAQNPLNLRLISVLTRSGLHELSGAQSYSKLRERLFDAFVTSAIERRAPRKQFDKKTSFEQLAWIAYKMKAHRIPTFGIEQLQPSWLETEDARRTYASLHRAVTQSIAGAIIALLVFGVGIWQLEWTNSPLVNIESPIYLVLISALSLMFIGAYRGIRQGEASWQRGDREKIKPVEVIKWSFEDAVIGASKQKTVKFPTRYLIPLAICIGALLGFALANTLIEFIFWVLMSIITTIVIIETASIVQRRHELTTSLVESGILVETKEEKELPNEGIRLSARNAIIVGVGATFVIGIPIGIVRGIFLIPIWGVTGGLTVGLIRGLRDGAIAGTVLCGTFGGRTVIQHYSLRYMLWRKGLCPFWLNRFLQDFSDIGILKNLGGRYAFVYPLLFEYFARRGWKKYLRINDPDRVILANMYVSEPKRSRRPRFRKRSSK